ERDAEGDNFLGPGGDVGQRHELNIDRAERLRRREERRRQQRAIFQRLKCEPGGSPPRAVRGPAQRAGESFHEIAKRSRRDGRLVLHVAPRWVSPTGGPFALRAQRLRSPSGPTVGLVVVAKKETADALRTVGPSVPGHGDCSAITMVPSAGTLRRSIRR